MKKSMYRSFYKRVFAVTAAGVMAVGMTGCSKSQGNVTASTEEAEQETAAASESSSGDTTVELTEGIPDGYTDEEMFSDRDYEIGYSDEVTVTLKDGASTADGDGVTIDGDVITITDEGSYLFTGALSDGQIVVEADESDKVQIVLDGADITCSDSAAIYVITADKVFVTTTNGSENTLETSGEYDESDENGVDAVIFSKSDLTLNGAGTLTVNSDEGHGIVCKDDLKITSGTYEITAAGKALDANDSIRIAGGDITATAEKDALHVENEDDTDKGFLYVSGGTLNLTSGSDAVDATGNVVIRGGDWEISAADDGIHTEQGLYIADGDVVIAKSYEGLEGTLIDIIGGNIDVTASDDGLNASAGSTATTTTGNMQGGFGGGMFGSDGSQLIVSGGTLHVNADGDGVDSNGTLVITGGDITVDGPTSGGDSAIDYGTTGTISGGTLIAAGSSSMAESLSSDSTQGSILYIFGNTLQAGTSIVLKSSDGTELASYTTVKATGCIIISVPELTTGETYTLEYGDSSASIEMTSTVYSNGNGGMGGNGAMGGQGGFGGGQTGQNVTPSEEMTMPEDGETLELPEGMTMPEDGEMPEMPEGMTVPDDFDSEDGETPEMPEGGFDSQGGRGGFGGQMPGGQSGMGGQMPGNQSGQSSSNSSSSSST